MSTVINVEAPVTPPAEDPLAKAIAEAIARIKSVYELMPEIQRSPTKGLKRERAAKSVSDAFLEAAVVAKESVVPQAPLDGDRVRSVMTRGLRFEAVATAAEALARDVRYNAFCELGRGRGRPAGLQPDEGVRAQTDRRGLRPACQSDARRPRAQRQAARKGQAAECVRRRPNGRPSSAHRRRAVRHR